MEKYIEGNPNNNSQHIDFTQRFSSLGLKTLCEEGENSSPHFLKSSHAAFSSGVEIRLAYAVPLIFCGRKSVLRSEI